MLEKTNTQPRSLTRSGDNAGDIGQYYIVVPLVHHPQIGDHRGKGVVTDLGVSGGKDLKKGRFPRIGQPHKADIGDHLQFNAHAPLFTLLARLRETWGLVTGTLKVGVPLPPSAAAQQYLAFTLDGEIKEPLAGHNIEYHRPRRYLDRRVFALGAVSLAPGPRTTIASKKTLPHLDVRQRFHVLLRDEHDISAAPAVTTVGATLWNVLLASKRKAARSTVARADGDFRLIDEQDSTPYSVSIGRMETSFFPRRWWK